jgi:hypothetical protein
MCDTNTADAMRTRLLKGGEGLYATQTRQWRHLAQRGLHRTWELTGERGGRDNRSDESVSHRCTLMCGSNDAHSSTYAVERRWS